MDWPGPTGHSQRARRFLRVRIGVHSVQVLAKVALLWINLQEGLTERLGKVNFRKDLRHQDLILPVTWGVKVTFGILGRSWGFGDSLEPNSLGPGNPRGLVRLDNFGAVQGTPGESGNGPGPRKEGGNQGPREKKPALGNHTKENLGIPREFLRGRGFPQFGILRDGRSRWNPQGGALIRG